MNYKFEKTYFYRKNILFFNYRFYFDKYLKFKFYFYSYSRFYLNSNFIFNYKARLFFKRLDIEESDFYFHYHFEFKYLKYIYYFYYYLRFYLKL